MHVIYKLRGETRSNVPSVRKQGWLTKQALTTELVGLELMMKQILRQK